MYVSNENWNLNCTKRCCAVRGGTCEMKMGLDQKVKKTKRWKLRFCQVDSFEGLRLRPDWAFRNAIDGRQKFIAKMANFQLLNGKTIFSGGINHGRERWEIYRSRGFVCAAVATSSRLEWIMHRVCQSQPFRSGKLCKTFSDLLNLSLLRKVDQNRFEIGCCFLLSLPLFSPKW